MSSGFRINQAADDAAGLAISENLRGQIRGMKQASRNSEDGVSLVQVAEGGLNEMSNMLIRLRELGVQAASDTIGDTERKFLDVEYQQLKSEMQRISEVTKFNGRDLLNGTGGILDIQVGVYNDPFKDRISFNTAAANSTDRSSGPQRTEPRHEGISTTVADHRRRRFDLGELDARQLRCDAEPTELDDRQLGRIARELVGR